MTEVKMQKDVSMTESGILAKLWRKILTDTNMINSLDYMITRYVNRSNSIKTVKRKTKSSLVNDITSTHMTWKTFTNLLFNFIGVIKMDINIKLYYSNGENSTHTISVKNNANEDNENGHDKSTNSDN